MWKLNNDLPRFWMTASPTFLMFCVFEQPRPRFKWKMRLETINWRNIILKYLIYCTVPKMLLELACVGLVTRPVTSVPAHSKVSYY